MAQQQQSATAMIGELKYYNKVVLGRGSYGTVFKGEWKQEKVAVKRLQLTDLNNDHTREEEAMAKFDHPNVVKLFKVEESDEFKFLVLEWCDATVCDYINKVYMGSMPPEINALIQMAEGLAYIHSKNFVHRDIKPGNVLICTKLQLLKISDFGLCRPVTETSGSFSAKSGPQGTKIYYAPEFLKLDEIKIPEERERIRCNVSIDVFSLGCLFFSYITKGNHLFAEPGTKTNKEFSIPPNIIEGRKFLSNGIESNHYARDIIDGMTKADPNGRLRLDKVIETLNTMQTKPINPLVR